MDDRPAARVPGLLRACVVRDAWGSLRPLMDRSARVGSAYLLAQVPAFFVPVAIAAIFGATATTDAFFFAFAVASFVVNSVVGASQAAVPYLVADDGRALRRGTRLLTCIAVGLQLAAVLALGPLVQALGAVPAERRGAAQAFLFALTPFVALSAASAIWTSATSARRDYLAGASAQGLRSLLLVGLVITAGPVLGVWGLLLAYVAAELARVAALYFRLPRPSAFGFSPGAVGDGPGVGGLTGSLLAQVAGSALVAVVPIIDRTMALSLGPGSASLLEYAERIWQVPLTLAMTGFTVVSLTEWSRDAQSATSRGSVAGKADVVAGWFFAATLPLCVAFVVFPVPVTTLLFGHGALPPDELLRLSTTLAALVAGVPIYLAGLVYSRLFLAARRSDLLFAIALAGVGLKVTLNLVLSPRWGLPGLAAATSLMYGFNSLALVSMRHVSPAFRPGGGPIAVEK